MSFRGAFGKVFRPAFDYGLSVISGIPWLLRDEFPVDQAAPLTSPRACSPGPGTLTLLDTGNKLSIASNKLVCAGQTGVGYDPKIVTASSYARSAGLATFVSVSVPLSGIRWFFGWGTGGNFPASPGVNFFGVNDLYPRVGVSALLGTWLPNTNYQFVCVLRSAGGFILGYGGAYALWTILWIDDADTTALLYSQISLQSNVAYTADDLSIVQMGAPWVGTYDLVTQRLAGNRTAGDTFTHEANCIIEYVVTTRAATSQVSFRIQNAGLNEWSVRIDDSGAMELRETIAGADFSRGTAPIGTVLNGHRVVIICDGATIRVYSNNTHRMVTVSATNFQFATSGRLASEGVGGSISDIISWPRNVSGAALTELQKYITAYPWLLKDDFTDTLAGGFVNGTAATPGPGTRTVVDANLKLSIGSGLANFVAGGVAAGNPGLWYGGLARSAGGLLVFEITPGVAGGTNVLIVGLDSNQSGEPPHGIRFANSSIAAYISSSGNAVAGYIASTSYKVILVVRSTGLYYFVKGGTFANWSLLQISNIGNDNPYYPTIGHGPQTQGAGAFDFIRVPNALWLPTPLAYDTFTRANGALGSTETTGPDGQVTPAKVWTGATWSIATNVAKNTPSLGGDLVVNGNMETGDPPSNWSSLSATLDGVADERTGGAGAQSLEITTAVAYEGATQNITVVAQKWYRIEMWMKNLSDVTLGASIGNVSAAILLGTPGVGSWRRCVGAFVHNATSPQINISPQGAAVGKTMRVDDITVKALTTSELFSSVQSSKSDVVASVNISLPAESYYSYGSPVGLVMNLDSASNPLNFILVRQSGNYISTYRCVNGVYALLGNEVKGFVNLATLTAITYHSDATTLKVRVYYNNSFCNEYTVTDATIRDNTLHGLFSTYEGNTLDNFTLFARGSGAEYDAALDPYIA